MRWVVLLVMLVACGNKAAAIAELTKADATVDKQTESPDWSSAPVGTEFFLGHAARTSSGGAQLAVAGGAQIAMQPHTILRFGGKSGQSKISVETGTIELSGTGNYSLDIGEVSLKKNGTVRITAGGIVKLTLGEAEVQTVNGKTVQLALGEELELGTVEVTKLVDAGVPVDAPILAETPDAAVVTVGEASVEVTGKKGEMLKPGETKWTPLPAGTTEVPEGAKLKLGAGTTAKLTARGTTLELAGGSRVTIAEDYGLALDGGNARMVVTGEGAVKVPGGAVALKSTGTAPSEAKLDGGGGGTKVTSQRGGAKLTGTTGSELDLARGESATVLKNGTIRPLEAIPTYYDFQITVGETLTIHDPRPPTAVQFQFNGKCPQGGIVEIDKDPRFRTAKISAGKEAANHLLRGGGYSYRLRCTSGANEGGAVETGRIAVLADAGTRKIPPPGKNPFEPDGRGWAISYQSAIPDLVVKFPGAGSNFKLHLARGNKDLTFESSTNRLLVKGSALSEGTYTYWFDRDGVKQDKVNTLKIDFDQTAPQVHIELPVNGKPWGTDIDVKGSVLPGWTAVVNGAPIALDKTRRFIARVGAPSGNALAIKLSHPQRGVHYYLRRQK